MPPKQIKHQILALSFRILFVRDTNSFSLGVIDTLSSTMLREAACPRSSFKLFPNSANALTTLSCQHTACFNKLALLPSSWGSAALCPESEAEKTTVHLLDLENMSYYRTLFKDTKAGKLSYQGNTWDTHHRLVKNLLISLPCSKSTLRLQRGLVKLLQNYSLFRPSPVLCRLCYCEIVSRLYWKWKFTDQESRSTSVIFSLQKFASDLSETVQALHLGAAAKPACRDQENNTALQKIWGECS